MAFRNNIDQLVGDSERIGVVGSPSSTNELALDILANAVTRKLVGELALFRYLQDDSHHYALGQITEIAMRNVWHEDPTMRSLVRHHGRVDAVSEKQDTHQGKMTISAVFSSDSGRYKPSILGTVPATGTPIHLVDDRVLDELLKPYQDQLFYLGRVYGSNPRLPLWFKHFDSGTDGAGEAYHIGIFGKTGSGKSVLAKMILLAYARHKSMGLFVLDPQGEFAKGLKSGGEPVHMGQALHPAFLKGLGKRFIVYDLSQIQLDRWEVFTQLLMELGFFAELTIKYAEYQETVADYVQNFMREKFKLADLSNSDTFLKVLAHIQSNIHRVYAGGDGINRVKGVIAEVENRIAANQSHPIKEIWSKIIGFFVPGDNRRTASDIIEMVLEKRNRNDRPMIVVDLSQRPPEINQSVWNNKIKPLLIDRFIQALTDEAERAYHDDRGLNTLVVIDEAHRLAPQGRIENERIARIRSRLVDAVRTTRKYGLGWMFLSQTLSSLDSEIVQQLRISFFGFGLSMGAEYQKLRELVSGQTESMNLYQRFRDPQSSFDASSKEYSFMTVGPVSPLSFSGTPLFLNAFNNLGDFVEANNLKPQGRLF